MEAGILEVNPQCQYCGKTVLLYLKVYLANERLLGIF